MIVDVVNPVRVRGTHPGVSRPGEDADIVGVRWVKPEGLWWRPCFELRYPDGKIDHVPFSEFLGTRRVVEDH